MLLKNKTAVVTAAASAMPLWKAFWQKGRLLCCVPAARKRLIRQWQS